MFYVNNCSLFGNYVYISIFNLQYFLNEPVSVSLIIIII